MNLQIDLCPGGPRFSRVVSGQMYLSRWDLSRAELLDWLHQALDLGVTTYDHADIYGSYTCEERFGEALRAEPGLRGRLRLVTKCGIKLESPQRPEHRLHSYDTSREHILRSAERSLANLGTDYLDLLLIHRPDPLMDADEVAAALEALVAAGKVRYVGVSNFTPAQFDLLASRLTLPLVTNQIELSLLHLDPLHDGTLDQCQRLGLAPMIWGPLAGGRLFREGGERESRVSDALNAVGEELGGAAPDQVALAWIMRHPARPLPVLGTGRLDRIRAAVAALELAMTREQWFRLGEASAGHEVP